MNNEDQCNPAAPEGQGDGAAGAAGGAGLSPLGEAALEYAACGIPVFPCVPGGKVPVPGVDSEDATTASGCIEEWWSEYPDANIGACPADFDAVVLDARAVVDQDLLARLRGEETLVHRTPHEGEHFFFNRPDRFDDGLFASGINAHCTTGYVLLPPSVVDGRPYQVLRNCGRITSFPGWTMERLAVGARASASGRNEADARQKAKNRFGGLSPSEGATLPPLTYWDEKKTLPRSNMGGCIGFLVGQFGSHKTGTAIMMALDAIQTHGARVLFIAAEDANGVAKTRLPAACKGRGLDLAELDSHWRTETETFDLLSDTDRAALIEAYREFAPDLIFIDVLTRVATADINAPETGMRVMQSVYALAAPFGATVVIAHHPGLSGTGRPMGSSLSSRADFCARVFLIAAGSSRSGMRRPTSPSAAQPGRQRKRCERDDPRSCGAVARSRFNSGPLGGRLASRLPCIRDAFRRSSQPFVLCSVAAQFHAAKKTGATPIGKPTLTAEPRESGVGNAEDRASIHPFTSLADFCLNAGHKDGVVSTCRAPQSASTRLRRLRSFRVW